ncbi:MAG: flagellar filament capping protein FliD [Campylobacterales bacterium]|nr:flagellar filament capping protein FliD [Campylobacterales bacterium]
MAGTVSSLGTLANGSSSVLNADLIDKLKSAETSARVTPITKQITTITNQKSALSSLIVSLSSVKTAAMDLSDEGSYLKRSATSSDSSVSISASSGTQTQTAAIKVNQLAQNHVMQSTGFSSTSASVSSTATTLKLNINSTNYTINISAGTTLEQLTQKINDATNGTISASTLNTGVGSNPYQLILKAKNSGEKNTISVTEGAGLSLGLSNSYTGSSAVQASTFTLDASNSLTINGKAILGTITGTTSTMNAQSLADLINNTDDVGAYASIDKDGKLVLSSNTGSAVTVDVENSAGTYTGLSDTTVAAGGTIQTPQNAKFTYNGISMERTSNSVTDLITGATITLNNKSTTTANLSITQNTSGIPDLVNTFISAFNSTSSKLKDLTAYDTATKTAGTLQGVAEVSSIYSSLTSILTKTTSDGKSLMDYGFELDKNGSLSVNSSTLSSKLASDPAALEKLFRGSSSITNAKYTAAMVADTTTNTTTAIGDITINGFAVGSVTTSTSNTAEQNAQLFVTAINKLTDSSGVKAYTDGSGKLILESTTGGNIKLATNAAAALASGLSSSSSVATPIYTSLVASSKTTSTEGIFKQLNTSLATLLTGNNASLTLLDASFQSQLDSRNEEKTNVTNDIATKYELMANQFAQYNSIISKFQQSFSSLQSMINSASNGN